MKSTLFLFRFVPTTNPVVSINVSNEIVSFLFRFVPTINPVVSINLQNEINSFFI
jgi:hypothetical protein